MPKSFIKLAIARGLGALLALLPESLLAEVWPVRQPGLRPLCIVGPNDVSVPSAEAAFLERVRTVVEARMDDSRFKVADLAREVGLSSRQLQRRLRASAQLSAAAFIRAMRLGRAAHLLERGTGTVAEVAYAVGFEDPKHFSKLFKQTFGVPPSQYRAGQT